MSAVRIEDYISETEMREIAIEEWRKLCREACNGNAERIISNIGYSVASSMVDEALGDGADQLIRDKVIDVINNLSEYGVFRRPDVWDREASAAYKALSSAVLANADLLNKKVREVIGQLSKREALEIIKAGKISINPA